MAIYIQTFNNTLSQYNFPPNPMRFSSVSRNPPSPETNLSTLRHHHDSPPQMLPDNSIPAVHFRFPSKIPTFELSQSPFPLLFQFKTIILQTLQSLLPSNSPPTPAPNRPPESGCAVPLFRPYVAKVPWHGGARGFVSQLFPRYGHYCGPNWSSGKAGGSLLWDRRPIDWLDFCCYCHDIGYDDHDQGKLLRADLDFLRCLERPEMATKGGAHISLLYRSMCIAGLRYVLIPYRMQLLRIQAGPSLAEIFGDWAGKIDVWKQGLERKGL